MTKYCLITFYLILCFFLLSCGGNKNVTFDAKSVDSVSGATKKPAQEVANSHSANTTGDAQQKEAETVHICKQPMEKTVDIWPRIESIRALSQDEFNKGCDLDFVLLLGKWRCTPADLLGPIVKKAGENKEELINWVIETSKTQPAIAANVVAMDIIINWEIGTSSKMVIERKKMWQKIQIEGEHFKNVIETTSQLAPLFKEIDQIHKLRCKLEVNPLGFAVKCTPIHPSGKDIKLNWKTTLTDDDLIVDLEVTKCIGSSCKKIKKTTAQLKKKYLALVEKVEKIKVVPFKEQIKLWLRLPKFTSI